MQNPEEKYNRRRLKSSYITTTLSISLVLFMLGLLGLILLNANRWSENMKEDLGLSVIINDQVSTQEILQYQKKLEAYPFVKSTDFVTKEKAAKNFKEEIGEDFVDFLAYNPLYAHIDIKVYAPYANNDSLQNIKRIISANSIVNDVDYQKNMVQQVNDNIQKITIFLLSFSTILILIAIALINNTIRLSVYSKRFLIRTMMLVGATQRFIRKPFLLVSVYYGFIGAIISIFFITGVLYLIQTWIPGLVDFQQLDIFLALLGILILFGIVFSWISTYFAVGKYIHLKEDKLYR